MGWPSVFYEISQIEKIIKGDERLSKLNNSAPIVAKDVNGYPSGISNLDNVEEGSLWFRVEEIKGD
jgi:hypothetical protein